MQTKNCIDCKDSLENCDVADQGKREHEAAYGINCTYYQADNVNELRRMQCDLT